MALFVPPSVLAFCRLVGKRCGLFTPIFGVNKPHRRMGRYFYAFFGVLVKMACAARHLPKMHFTLLHTRRFNAGS